MYICDKCSKDGIIKRHRSGKIYEEHWKYRRVERPEYDSTQIQEIDFELRPIARRQLAWLRHKMKLVPSAREMYTIEINRLIDYERKREKNGQKNKNKRRF
jgi:hypothetical protein